MTTTSPWQVGKTYWCRDGKTKATIERLDFNHNLPIVVQLSPDPSCVYNYNKQGSFANTNMDHRWDLTHEVVPGGYYKGVKASPPNLLAATKEKSKPGGSGERVQDSATPPCPFEPGKTYDMVGGGSFHVYAIVRNSKGAWTIDGRATYDNPDMGGISCRRLDGTAPPGGRDADALIAPNAPPIISDAAVWAYAIAYDAAGVGDTMKRRRAGIAAAIDVMLDEGVITLPVKS